MAKKSAILIHSSTDKNKDLLYATGFDATDAFTYIRTDKEYMIVNPLEYGRAVTQSGIDEVVNDNQFREQLKEDFSTARKIDLFLKGRGIKRLVMPYQSDAGLVDELRALKYKVTLASASEPFFPQRRTKTSDEIEMISQAQQANEKAMASAVSMIGDSTIGEDGFLYDMDGTRLTSEMVRRAIDRTLILSDCISSSPAIVACGDDATNPHSHGEGPLRANESIVIDIFPYSRETGYFGDMTRTVVRGKASPELKQMYEVVKQGQEMALMEAVEGTNNRDLTFRVRKFFEANGFSTNLEKGEGFFHGLGHGVGLEIHEQPMGR